MEILNSREIAIGLWLIVIALYIFFSKKMVEVRAAFKQLTFVFRFRPLIMVFFRLSCIQSLWSIFCQSGISGILIS